MKVWLSVTLAIKINVHNCKCDIKKSSTAKSVGQRRVGKKVFSSALIRKFRDNAVLRTRCINMELFVSLYRLWVENVRSFTGSYYERLHYGTWSTNMHIIRWLALMLSFTWLLSACWKQLDYKVVRAVWPGDRTPHEQTEKSPYTQCVSIPHLYTVLS